MPAPSARVQPKTDPGLSRLLPLGVIALGTVIFVLQSATVTVDAPVAAGLVLCLVMSDLLGVRLPGAGRFAVSFGMVLVMAMTAKVGVALAAAAVLFSQLIALVFQPGHATMSVALLAALVETVPQMLALASIAYFQGAEARGFAGAAVYLAAIALTPSQLAAALPHDLGTRLTDIASRLMPIRLCTCLLGLLTSILCSLKGWPYLALTFPLFLLLRYSAQTVLALDEEREREDVLRKLNTSNKLLDSSSKHQTELQKRLTEKSQELQLLEVAANTFLNAGTPLETAQSIIQLCGKLTSCTSVVIFLFDGTALVPVAHSTPHANRLAGSVLSGIREPAVEMAWRSGQIQIMAKGLPGQRIFEGEDVVSAFPWPRLGVLYLGRRGQPFQEAEGRFLHQAASLGGLGLRIALQLEELQKSLAYQQTLTGQLDRRSNSLDQLLRHSLLFMGTLDLVELQEILKSALGELFPNCDCYVNLTSELSNPVEQAIMASRSPIVIDDLATARFERSSFPAAEAVSLIAVPIIHPGHEQVAVMSVTSRTGSMFGRHERDLLMILSYLAAVAWKNAELHQATCAAQAQLVQSSKMAAVGQLAGGVAHELNTPLGSIALNLDFAKQMLPKDNEKIQARLQKASEMVTRTQAIVEKLLYYSRESNSERRPTLLKRLVGDTVDLIEHALMRDQVQVKQNVDSSLVCEVNQNEIQQVIFNLLLNARDAVSSVDVERRIVAIDSGATADKVFLRVVDQGVGISSADIGRIFDPFFTTKPVGSGTGLGLSVSMQLIKAHGGDLRCQSQEGKGAEFIIELPRSPASSLGQNKFAE